MSEIIEDIDMFLEQLEDAHPIDDFVMGTHATKVYDATKEIMVWLREQINTYFPEFDEYLYKKAIVYQKPHLNEFGDFAYDGNVWQTVEFRKLQYGAYEVFLRRKK